MKSLPPPSLKPGDTIGVMAPSSWVEAGDIEQSKMALASLGYKVFIHPQTFARHHQSAGTASEKINALHDLFKDETIKAIWAAGGGNLSLEYADRLDFKLIKKNPKPVIGFSDATALLNIIYAHTGLIAIHAPVFTQFHTYDLQHDLLSLLRGQKTEWRFSQCRILKPGAASGHLIGGNLSLFQYMRGTVPEAMFKNFILFLEDCGEETSRIERMFLHLARTGVLQKAGGLILGQFSFMTDTGRRPYALLDDILEKYAALVDGPVWSNAPFGHKGRFEALPLGASVSMRSEDKMLTLIK